MKALVIIVALLMAIDAAVNHGAVTLSLLHGLARAADNFQTALSGSIFAQ